MIFSLADCLKTLTRALFNAEKALTTGSSFSSASSSLVFFPDNRALERMIHLSFFRHSNRVLYDFPGYVDVGRRGNPLKLDGAVDFMN